MLRLFTDTTGLTMNQWITDLINSAGYAGLTLLMFLENLFPPIPSELIMPLAGYLAGQEKLTLAGAIIAGTLGSVLGALPFYLVGRLIGEERLNHWIERHGHWVGMSLRDLRRVSRFFDQYGPLVVLFGRLIPGIRSVISIPAGLYCMPISKFLIYTALGSGIWSALLATAGYWLGQNFDAVSTYIDPASKIIIGSLLIAWLARIVHHYVSGQGRRR